MKKALQFILALLAIVIVIPILIATFRPNLIISKADEKARFTQPASHFLQWRGAEIHYTDEGSGIPVIMIFMTSYYD